METGKSQGKLVVLIIPAGNLVALLAHYVIMAIQKKSESVINLVISFELEGVLHMDNALVEVVQDPGYYTQFL